MRKLGESHEKFGCPMLCFCRCVLDVYQLSIISNIQGKCKIPYIVCLPILIQKKYVMNNMRKVEKYYMFNKFNVTQSCNKNTSLYVLYHLEYLGNALCNLLLLLLFYDCITYKRGISFIPPVILSFITFRLCCLESSEKPSNQNQILFYIPTSFLYIPFTQK